MFGVKKDKDVQKLETIIGKDSVFQGTIKTKHSLRIDGRLEGNVAEAHGVIVGDTGIVQGDITAQVVTIGGKVTGNVTALQSLEILPKAQLYGDIHTALLTIGEGAVFEGNCVMTTEKKVIEMNVSAASQR